MIFRLSGTAGSGATVRLYLEKYEPDQNKLGLVSPLDTERGNRELALFSKGRQADADLTVWRDAYVSNEKNSRPLGC